MTDRFRGNSVPVVRGYDLTTIEEIPQQDERLIYRRDRIFSLGGLELWTLYNCYMNFDLAASELNMTEGALRKWFQRWRSSARIKVLDRLSFHLYCCGQNVH